MFIANCFRRLIYDDRVLYLMNSVLFLIEFASIVFWIFTVLIKKLFFIF